MVFLQTDRKRTDRASDQNQFEGDHDAERPWECHLQGGEPVLQMLDSKTLQRDALIIEIWKQKHYMFGFFILSSVFNLKENVMPTFSD